MYDQCNHISIVNNEGNLLWEVILTTDLVSKRGDFREQVMITYYVYAATKIQSIEIAKSWLPLWDVGIPKYIVSEGVPVISQLYIPDSQRVRKEHRNRQSSTQYTTL